MPKYVCRVRYEETVLVKVEAASAEEAAALVNGQWEYLDLRDASFDYDDVTWVVLATFEEK